MKKTLWIGVFQLILLIAIPNNGICIWPFGGDDNEKIAKVEEMIKEYKKFEKKGSYSDEMFKKVRKIVKGDGRKNLTLRMAYMRLRYYKATEERDQDDIQEVSNEAESLFKDDYPLFRQQIGEKEVNKFLSALKDARYNEKKRTSWWALLITCVVSILLCMIAFGAIFGGMDKGGEVIPIIIIVAGLILGLLAYYFMVDKIFYTTTIEYSTIPLVPIVG